MSTSDFDLNILLFGPAAQAAGCGSVRVVCVDGSTCDTVLEAMSDQYSSIASIIRAGRLAVNGSYAEGSAVIHQSDEVALVSLVSGG